MYEVDSFDGGPRAQHRLSDETSATANGESGGLAVLLSREEKLKGKRVCKFKFKDATDRPVIKATLTAARNRCRRCKPDITLGVLNGVRLVPGARVIVQASERGVEAECDDNRRAHQLGVRQAQARDSEHLTRIHTQDCSHQKSVRGLPSDPPTPLVLRIILPPAVTHRHMATLCI